ncbi:MAG: GNAT family N-acetyltransferase [Bdellovibrionales bacterium]|nr:GNAT family N-acetyltransferase [Bdellovibrionales bacterium]
MKSKDPLITLKVASESHIDGIIELCKRVYPQMPPYSKAHIKGHLNHFQQGQFIVEYMGEIVGYCATFRVAEEKVLQDHNWREITGGGYATQHDPVGDCLYGFEVCVDPKLRGKRIGNRLYQARKDLCESLNLKGVYIVGRMPMFKKNLKKVGTPENYVSFVKNKKIRDSTLLFQFRNNFEIVKVLKDYLPIDDESQGNGLLMFYANSKYRPDINKQGDHFRTQKTNVRIATVQFKQRKVSTFEGFIQNVRYFVDVASGYNSDFVVFPEWFTMQLLSIENEPMSPAKSLRHLSQYTDRMIEEIQKMSLKFNINIIGGSTSEVDDQNQITNTSYVFLRDGTVHKQSKIHPTPNEVYWWGLKGDNQLHTIETDCGTIGVLICYDSEFPELARHLTNQGMLILFVPFCTDERKSYMRVRYSCHARAIENQIYVVMSGNVGNLPGVENMDIQYAQSCILTPCDFAFARDGIAADTSPNVETVSIADLNMHDLLNARNTGTVRNLKDRRHDLYNIQWLKE